MLKKPLKAKTMLEPGKFVLLMLADKQTILNKMVKFTMLDKDLHYLKKYVSVKVQYVNHNQIS